MTEILTTPHHDSDLSERVQDPVIVAPDVHADVVIVYLEGLDRGFADKNNFGDIYAPIEELEPEATTFTGLAQITGTSWSLAGELATQCGLPLIPNGLRNFYKFETQNDFLAGHICLGDVLATQGYRNVHIVGAAIGFGGQDHFLHTHQFDTIIDKSVIADMFPADFIRTATAARILDDQLVLDVALDTYQDMVKEPAPLSLVVATTGPHGNSGTLSRNCIADNQSIETGNIHATAACTIASFVTFFEGLKAARGTRPTLLVAMSDHLNHA